MKSLTWFSSLILALSVGAHLEAHEGHAPLPTRGAEVNVATGQITLSAEAQKALGVETAEAELRSIDETVLAYATVALSWQQHRFVTTPIAGRIAKVAVKPGEVVGAGQLLAEVQSTDLENLQLELLEAQNKAELSHSTLERVERLAKDQVIPLSERTEAVSLHNENLNSLEIARTKLLRLRLSEKEIDQVLETRDPIKALSITSPLTGVAIHSDLAVGRVVDPTEHLFEVMDLSSVGVRIEVLERDLARVREGQQAVFSLPAFPGQAFHGVVTVKEKYLEPVTHLGRVWMTVPNEGVARLLPGMSGQAKVIVSPKEEKITVPAAALLTNGTESFVLVEEAATTRGYEYRRQNVVVGRQGNGWVEIVSGEVFPSDQVVTTGAHELGTFFLQGILQLSPEARQNLGVRVEAAGKEPIGEVFEVDGAVDLPPEQRAVASAQLQGTLEQILVERGQAVKAGDVVALVSSLEFHEVQLELLQANLQIALLENTLSRLRGLSERQVVARKRLLETESLHTSAVDQRDNAERRLRTLGLSKEQLDAITVQKKLVDLLPVRSPIDGVVVRFDRALGEVIKAEEPIFEIHDLSRILVRAHLSQHDAARAPVGTKARVRVLATPTFIGEGRVVRSGGTFAEENRTLSAWVELEQAPRETLFHNMLARLVLETGKELPTLGVPRSAVAREGTRNYVFVQDQKGVLHRRPVELGRSDDRYVAITKGLVEGEMVAIQGAANLQTAYASLR